MKIAKVEPIPVAYPEPNDYDAIRYLCLVKITTDEGVVGWGESITQFPEANPATAAIITGMAELLIGSDPVNTEALWRQMKDRAWWYGYGGGIASYAISAIDIALWDLKGKILGKSVLELLGGSVHERLPAIADSHAHHESIPAMADEAIEWLSTGMKGMKVGLGKRGNARLGYEHDRDVQYMKAMREAVGDDKKIMLDCGIAIKWDVAYGEREWDVAGYERILETGTCDVFGVDPARAEGITGFKKVCDRVEYYKRQGNAHAWSSAIVTAASLAVSFSSPSCKLFGLKPLRNPMQHELVENPIEHVDGWLYPPTTRPGLGIEVREEVVDRYRQ